MLSKSPVSPQPDIQSDLEKSTDEPAGDVPAAESHNNINDFTVQTVRKRVPGKFVDQFWAPLNADALNSLEKIISVCSSKAVERYRRSGQKVQLNNKMASAQEIVASNWSDTSNRSSFVSRLRVTKVPLPSSHAKRNSAHDPNVLALDSLNRRKKFLETYLLAELKQLSELECYHKEVSTACQQDQKYLNEFRKTTDIEIRAMAEETAEKRRVLGLDNTMKYPETNFTEKPAATFDPNSDDETRALLEKIHAKLDGHQDTIKDLSEVDSALEVLYNILDMEE